MKTSRQAPTDDTKGRGVRVLCRLAAFALLIPVGCVSLPPLPSDGTETAHTADPRASYRLPFPAGVRHLCVQAGPGPFGHVGAERYAVDFKMAPGSLVVAARPGRVVGVKADSTVGGPSKKYRGHANYVRIEHDDGTRASYLHLQPGGALVERGQRVERGQPIGTSGDTGRSSLPHLHFHVIERDPVTGVDRAVRVTFEDVRGNGVPQLLVIYESGNAPPGGVAPAQHAARAWAAVRSTTGRAHGR